MEFVESIHSNDIAGVYALHRCHTAIRWADRDIAHRGGLVGLHFIDISVLGVALKCRRRNQRDTAERLDQEPRVDELVRKKGIVPIWIDRFEPDCPGGCVDQIVQGKHCSGGNFLLQCAVECSHLQTVPTAHLSLNLWDKVLRNAENYGYRV